MNFESLSVFFHYIKPISYQIVNFRERFLKNVCLTKLIPVSLLMEKEKAAAAKNKETDENKEQITNEDAIARGDNLRPCEPKEKAMEPGKGSDNLTTSRQDITSHEHTSHDDIQRSCQQLIDDINSKRKRDTDLVNDFKKALEEEINTSCNILEESIVQTYEKHSKTIQDKLQELFAVVERISKLEGELIDFKQALGVLYNDMQVVERSRGQERDF
ncbi:synaptonemal complex central element protein 2-like [Acropora millepora]|uniref:synaptonemal complex central element protein 2-like n=1 Tax=Acropora millepora TaxID=45264 RepID=UPI001CF5DC1D|nr:synaptonemal complex central element protein 2-like [Acropora millepora]